MTSEPTIPAPHGFVVEPASDGLPSIRLRTCEEAQDALAAEKQRVARLVKGLGSAAVQAHNLAKLEFGDAHAHADCLEWRALLIEAGRADTAADVDAARQYDAELRDSLDRQMRADGEAMARQLAADVDAAP